MFLLPESMVFVWNISIWRIPDEYKRDLNISSANKRSHEAPSVSVVLWIIFLVPLSTAERSDEYFMCRIFVRLFCIARTGTSRLLFIFVCLSISRKNYPLKPWRQNLLTPSSFRLWLFLGNRTSSQNTNIGNT